MRTDKHRKVRNHRKPSAPASCAAPAAAVARIAAVEALEPRQLLSTYFVSSAGSDAATGEAMTAAWKTLNRVNSQKLQPGDKVLFAIGQTFSGTINVPSAESGS